MRRTTLGLLVLLTSSFVLGAGEGDDTPMTPKVVPPGDVVQGDYLGRVEGEVIAAQVIALGGGEFELKVYRGGLPGAGAEPGDAKTAKGKNVGGVTKFAVGTRTATIENGALTLFESGKAVATLKKSDGKNPMPAKQPADGKNPALAKQPAEFASTTVPVDGAKLVRRLPWSADGKSLFVLQADGLIRKLALPDFHETNRLALDAKCSDLALSSLGPVVLLDATQHVVLLDDDLNEVKREHVPGVVSLTSAPTIDHAFLIGDHIIGAWNLKTSRINPIPASSFARTALRVKRTTPRPAGIDFLFATCTSDGEYLLTSADYRITRFRIRRSSLILEEQGWQIGHSGTPAAMNVGGDPPRVSLIFGAGNDEAPGHPKVGYGTYVYDVTDLRTPVTTIEPGPYPQTVGFDTAAGLVYGQTVDQELVVFNDGGAKLGSFNLGKDGRSYNERTVLIVPHPEGGRTLVLTDMNLYWCTLPKKWVQKNPE